MSAVSAGAAVDRGQHALGVAFQQVLQGIRSIQEAFLAQERRLEERFGELERKMQEHRQATRANGVAEALTSVFEERLQIIERKMEEMERRSLLSRVEPSDAASRREKRLANLESQMKRLDVVIERALHDVLPRVDVLLIQLETSSPPVAPAQPIAAPAAPSLFLPCASCPVPCARVPTAGNLALMPRQAFPKRRKILGRQLMDAVVERNAERVLRLMADGADLNYVDPGRQVPLIYACRNSDVRIVSLLIRMGAYVNARSARDSTPLHFAAYCDKSGQCASLLVHAGAAVDVMAGLHQTPLFWAALADNVMAARVLIAAGAWKSFKDMDGNMPFEYAKNDNLRALLQP